MGFFIYKRGFTLEAYLKDKLIARISSGIIRYKTLHQVITLRSVNTENKYIAEELYDESLLSAQEEGLYSQSELMDMLFENDLWSGVEEERLTTCLKNLDEFKLKYFQIKFRDAERRKVKDAIQITKEEISSLQSKKHKYDYLSCNGYAACIKLKFLTGMSAHTDKGPLFNSPADYLDYDGTLIDNLLIYLQDHSIAEREFRELARTEPWRIVWNTRKATSSVFTGSAVELTDEQKQLVTWSIVYDNIHESTDCPTESVINDDDALDGWFIMQRNKRQEGETEDERQRILNNPALKDAHEVYLPVVGRSADDTEISTKEVEMINGLNTPAAEAMKRRRLNTVKNKGGTAHELEMPDTKQRLQIAFNERYKQHVGL